MGPQSPTDSQAFGAATLCEWRHWGRPLQRPELCTGENCTVPSIPLQARHHLLGPFRLRPGMLWPPLDCQWPTDSSLLAILTLTQTPLEWVAGIHWKGQGGGGSWRGWRTNSHGQAQPFKARGSTLGLCPWLGVKHLVWLASLVFSFGLQKRSPRSPVSVLVLCGRGGSVFGCQQQQASVTMRLDLEGQVACRGVAQPLHLVSLYLFSLFWRETALVVLFWGTVPCG